jgi:hypothetical protein
MAKKGFIEIDGSAATAKLLKQAKYLDSRSVIAAQVDAINRGARAAQTRWNMRVRGTINARREAVEKAFELSLARFGKPEATIKVKGGYLIPLRDFFGVKQVDAGVQAKMFKNRPAILIRGAFIAGPKIYNQVVQRVGKASKPLRIIYGPSIKSQAQKFESEAQARFQEVYEPRLKQQIQRRIDMVNR